MPLKRKSPAKNTPCTKLRTQIILFEIRRMYNLSTYEIDRNNNLNKLPWKWVIGVKSIGRKSAMKLDKAYPKSNIKELYNSPLFRLLENRPLSKSNIKNYLSSYITDNGPFLTKWDFQDEEGYLRNRMSSPPIIFEDCQNLYERGDVLGFIAILGLARLAEADDDICLQVTHIQFLYRAFPAFAKDEPYFSFAFPILDLVEKIASNTAFKGLIFSAKKDVILQQILDPEFEPNRNLRIKKLREKGITGSQQYPEDPFITRESIKSKSSRTISAMIKKIKDSTKQQLKP